MVMLSRWTEFMEQAQTSLKAAELTRREGEDEVLVNYFLKRAEIFARLAQSTPKDRQ